MDLAAHCFHWPLSTAHHSLHTSDSNPMYARFRTLVNIREWIHPTKVEGLFSWVFTRHSDEKEKKKKTLGTTDFIPSRHFENFAQILEVCPLRCDLTQRETPWTLKPIQANLTRSI